MKCGRCAWTARALALGWEHYARKAGLMLPSPFAMQPTFAPDNRGHVWIAAGLAPSPKLRRLLAFLDSRCPPFVTNKRRVRCCRLHWYAQLLAVISMGSPLADSFALRRVWDALEELSEEEDVEEPIGLEMDALPFPALGPEGIKFE